MIHSTTFLSVGCFIIATLGQSTDSTAVVATSTTIDVSDSSVSACASAKSTSTSISIEISNTYPASLSTSTPFPLTNMTTLPSNLSTTLVTISSSGTNTASFMNTSLSAPETSTIPTVIMIATGSPIVPGIGETVTSYKIVTPARTSPAASATSSPTQAKASIGKSISVSGIAVILLGLSSLLLA